MDSEQRSEWYRVAREVPLSGKHASHIAARLTDDEVDEVEKLEGLWRKDAGEER